MIKNVCLFLFVTVLPAFLVEGCGGASGAPTGSTIAISPSSVPWAIKAGGVCDGTQVNYTLFTIAVADKNGVPQNNVDVTLTLDLSANVATPPIQAVTMWDDPNWNGTGPPQNQVPTPYRTKTGAFGVKQIIVGVDVGCPYKVNLNAYSGSAFGTANISITAS